MSMASTKNPIVIRKNGKKARLQELKLEMGKDFQIIEVYSSDGKILIKQNITNLPYLSLDSELGTVKVVYRNVNDEYIDDEVLDLTVHESDEKYYTKEELVYRKIRDEIAEQMDNPPGTEKEKAEHTRLLKETSVYEHARKYVMSRIRRLLIAR